MAQFPDMRLSPEATPWGRMMQQKLEDLERGMTRRTQAEMNANAGENATLAALANQILTIQSQQASLSVTQANLATAQNTLTGQQTFLSGLITVADAKTTTQVDNEPPSPEYYLPAFRSGIDPTVTLAIPTGHALVSVTAFADLAIPGSGSAMITYSPEMLTVDPTPVDNTPGVAVGTDSWSSNAYLRTGATFQKFYAVTPGTYTVRVRTSFNTGGSSTGMVLTSYYRSLSVQVIP